jgi:transcriptional regulator with XRE-family HTH domain
MISQEKIDKSRELIDKGFTQRHIASELGISRGTVASVASGSIHSASLIKAANESCSYIPPSGQCVRCPECGAFVQMPCLSCYIENGDRYPDSVLELLHNPRDQKEEKRCVKCGKVKNHLAFNQETLEMFSDKMVYSTCIQCRNELARSKCSKKKRFRKKKKK